MNEEDRQRMLAAIEANGKLKTINHAISMRSNQALSTRADTGVNRYGIERKKFGPVVDEIYGLVLGKRPSINNLGLFKQITENNAQYQTKGMFTGRELDRPLINMGKNARYAKDGMDLRQEPRSVFNYGEEKGFILGHEYGHHLQNETEGYPKGDMTVDTKFGRDFVPAYQFDADITGYVMAENAGINVSLNDSTASIHGVSLLDLINKRRKEIDAIPKHVGLPAIGNR